MSESYYYSWKLLSAQCPSRNHGNSEVYIRTRAVTRKVRLAWKRWKEDSRMVKHDPDYGPFVTLENETFAKRISRLAQVLNLSKELELWVIEWPLEKKKKQKDLNSFLDRLPADAATAIRSVVTYYLNLLIPTVIFYYVGNKIAKCKRRA